jgi:hypothetical protein
MRFCTNCKKITAGRPPFCQFCARSYSVKLCPRGHSNPRAAQACSTCGSKELSTPAPQMGMSKIGYLIGFTILIALSVYAIYFAIQLADRVRSGAFDAAFLRLMDTGVELGVLLLFWMLLFGRKKK